MKFRNIALLIIVAIILTAWLTRPGAKDFEEFRQRHKGAIVGPPSIEEKNGIIYSMFTVTYFQPQVVPAKDGQASTEMAVPALKEKYLGLFGKFWKLD